jgi:hypothetical protein
MHTQRLQKSTTLIAYNVKNKRSMKTTELKELMPPHVVDVQGHGINEFYTPEQVVEILRLLGVVGQSEQLCECKCEYPIIRTGITEYCSICQLEVK